MRVRRTENFTHALFRGIRIRSASFASDASFTLIELLIVIGILAILVAAVVVILNPAQLLAQARDSKRQQDLSALNQALQTVSALDQSLSFGTSSIVYTSLPDSTTTCATWNLPSLPSGWTYHCVATSTLQNTNGTGWIPVNFQSNGVVSLSALPTDPVNTSSTGLYYTYVSGGSYELTATFESSKYKLGGDKDIASTDGGLYPDLYEVGSNLSLQPLDYGDPSLVGYWPLDEGTGTIAYDRSGKGHNGILVNSPTWIIGKNNGALRFSSSSVGTPNITTTQAMTSVLWFNPLDLSSSQNVMYKNDGGFPWTLYRNNFWPTSQFGWLRYCNCTNGNVIAQGIYNSGQWYHVVFVTTQDGLYSLYINGLLATSGNALGFSSWKVASSIVGLGAGGSYYTGSLDDVRIYNRALSASEIQALYSATK